MFVLFSDVIGSVFHPGEVSVMNIITDYIAAACEVSGNETWTFPRTNAAAGKSPLRKANI